MLVLIKPIAIMQDGKCRVDIKRHYHSAVIGKLSKIMKAEEKVCMYTNY